MGVLGGYVFWMAAAAADQATATATARAEVLQQISAVNTAELDFGTISRSTIAGTVTIAANGGGRSVSGGVSGAGGTPHPAQFLATGSPDRTYTIDHDSSATLTSGNGDQLAVTTLLIDGPTMRQFNSMGESTIGVGGILSVAGDQPEGLYSGIFALTLNYQ